MIGTKIMTAIIVAGSLVFSYLELTGATHMTQQVIRCVGHGACGPR